MMAEAKTEQRTEIKDMMSALFEPYGENLYAGTDRSKADDKLSSDDWNACEERPPPKIIEVIRALMYYINPSENKTDTKDKNNNLPYCMGDVQWNAISDVIKKLKQKNKTDKNYVNVCDVIESFCVGDGSDLKGKKKGNKKGGAQSKSADEIRLGNTMDSIANDVDNIINCYCDLIQKSKKKRFDIFGLTKLIQVAPIEMKGILFLLAANHILHSDSESFSSGTGLADAYELIAGLQKFIERLSPGIKIPIGANGKPVHMSAKQKEEAEKESLMKGKNTMKPTEMIPVSSNFVKKLKETESELSTFFKSDATKMFAVRNHLVVKTAWDSLIPGTSIKPNGTQKEFSRLLLECLTPTSQPMCIFLLSTIGGGKTSSCVMFIMLSLMQRRNGQPRKQSLFCCNIDLVRNDVATSCIYSGIPCIIANVERKTIKRETFYKLTDGRIIRAPKKLERIMRQGKATGKFTFVDDPSAIDESTIKEKFEVEYENGKLVENVVWTAHYSAKHEELPVSIIAGPRATELMLQYGCLDVNVFVDEHTLNADDSQSEAMKMNCRIMALAPKLVVFASATSPPVDKLDNFKKDRTTKYPTGRFEEINGTEFSIALSMVDRVGGHKLFLHSHCTTVQQIKNLVKNTKTAPTLCRFFTHDTAQCLFERMESQSVTGLPNVSEKFRTITSLNPVKAREFIFELYELLIEKDDDELVAAVCAVDDAVDDTKSIDVNSLFTTDAHKLTGMSVIINSDPLAYAFKMFEPLYQRMCDDGFNYGNEESRVMKEIKDIKDRCAALQKSASKNLKSNNKSDERTTEQKIRELEEKMPSASVPNIYIPNTIEHVKENVPPGTIYVASKKINILKMEDIEHLDCCVELKILLIMGVFINAPSNPSLTKAYTTFGVRRMKEGHHFLVFADKSICVGANYSFENIFLNNDFAAFHSVNTIIQSLGRAGRVGLAYSASAYIERGVALKIVDYVTTDEFHNTVEADNMNNMQEFVLSEMKKECADDIAFMESKYQSHLKRDDVNESQSAGISVVNFKSEEKSKSADNKLIQFDWSSVKKDDDVTSKKKQDEPPKEKYVPVTEPSKETKSSDTWRRKSAEQKPNEHVREKAPKQNDGNWRRKPAEKQSDNGSGSYIPPHFR